jgi:hypothetical protein
MPAGRITAVLNRSVFLMTLKITIIILFPAAVVREAVL